MVHPPLELLVSDPANDPPADLYRTPHAPRRRAFRHRPLARRPNVV